MVARKLLVLFFLTLLLQVAGPAVLAQTCTTLGQTPATAFPVCGTSVFKQDSVPLCGNNIIPTPCNDGAQYSDRNPFWYKFTCFNSGTLGFLITPTTPTDDYDWQLFDVTGHSPGDVYSTPSLFVSANWSSNPNGTGASPTGTGSINCAGPTFPNQNAMPQLIQGHNYLLLISHFTNTQSGYSLSFGGGTASITDTTAPALASVQPICDGSQVHITLNKNMTCASLAADGSDFTISPSIAGVRVTGASSLSCGSGFDMDSLTLTLSGPLALGTTFTITANNGTDGNTVLDNCGTQIPVGQSLSFLMTPPQATPLDSLTPPSCAPSILQLVFQNKILCSSIAPDGSDFTVTGPTPVTVTGATGNCDANGTTYTVELQLAAPIQTAGNYQIRLAPGVDGNTLVNICGLATPGTTISFSTKDTVSAALFTDQILYGCKNDTVEFAYPTKNGVNQWMWVFDGADTSLRQDPPDKIYSNTGTNQVQLIVSNGFCSDTSGMVVTLDNGIKAHFEGPNIICPKDYAQFLNSSTGPVVSWTWNFGDGAISTLQAPPDHLYPLTGVETKYNVLLTVANAMGCADTSAQLIDVLRSCFIAVPSAFTPNGDGLNDYLYPLNAFKAVNLVFRVYNRTGQIVFESNDWTKKWDGTIQGHPEPAGTFVWTLQYVDGETGKMIFQKGTTILIR